MRDRLSRWGFVWLGEIAVSSILVVALGYGSRQAGSEPLRTVAEVLRTVPEVIRTVIKDPLLIGALVTMWVVAISGSMYAKLRVWRPGAYVSIGLAATFIGIVLTLSSFQLLPEAKPEEITKKFGEFLRDAGFAFRASAVGVCMSIVATLVNRWSLEADEEQLFNDAATSLVRTQDATVKSLQSAGDQVVRTATEQMTLVMKSAGEQFKRAADEAATILQRGSEAFAKALDTSSGRLSQSLEDASTSIQEASRTMTDDVSDMVDEIKEVADPIQAMAKTQEATVQQLALTADQIQRLVSALETSINRQSAVSSSFDQLLEAQKDATDALDIERKAVKKVAQELVPIAEAFERIPEALGAVLAESVSHAERLNNAAKSLAALENLEARLGPPIEKLVFRLDEQMAMVLEKINNEIVGITRKAGGSVKDLEASLFDSAAVVAAASSSHLDRIDNHLTQMDKHLHASSRSIEASRADMGTQFAAALQQLDPVHRRIDDSLAGILRSTDRLMETTQELRKAILSVSAGPPASDAEPIP